MLNKQAIFIIFFMRTCSPKHNVNFVVFITSQILHVMLYPNLLMVQKEGVLLQRIRTVKKFKYEKRCSCVTKLAGPQNTRSGIPVALSRGI